VAVPAVTVLLESRFPARVRLPRRERPIVNLSILVAASALAFAVVTYAWWLEAR
jgi:hypothetical protein